MAPPYAQDQPNSPSHKSRESGNNIFDQNHRNNFSQLEDSREAAASWEEVENLEREGKSLDDRIAELEAKLHGFQSGNPSGSTWLEWTDSEEDSDEVQSANFGFSRDVKSKSTVGDVTSTQSRGKSMFQFISSIRTFGISPPSSFKADKEDEFDDSHHTIASCPILPNSVILELEAKIKQANSEIDIMESQIQIQKDTLHHLQSEQRTATDDVEDVYVHQLEQECKEAEDELNEIQEKNQSLVIRLKKINHTSDTKKKNLRKAKLKAKEIERLQRQTETENRDMRETVNKRLQELQENSMNSSSSNEIDTFFSELIKCFDLLKDKEICLSEQIVVRTLERKEILTALSRVGQEQKKVEKSLNGVDDIIERAQLALETLDDNEILSKNEDNEFCEISEAWEKQNISLLSINAPLNESLCNIDKEMCHRIATINGEMVEDEKDDNSYCGYDNKDTITSPQYVTSTNESMEKMTKTQNPDDEGPESTQTDIQHLHTIIKERDNQIALLEKERAEQAALTESLRVQLQEMKSKSKKEKKSHPISKKAPELKLNNAPEENAEQDDLIDEEMIEMQTVIKKWH